LQDFFRSISVLSVPVLNGEAFGLYQLEALASGVPLVQPHLGAFPEIIAATGGGVTYAPNTAHALAENIGEVLSNQTKLEAMSLDGRKAVEEHFDSNKLSLKMVEIYKTLIAKNQC
jgi:glycosyltransferase involved in cell wall biosynthesis